MTETEEKEKIVTGIESGIEIVVKTGEMIKIDQRGELVGEVTENGTKRQDSRMSPPLQTSE